MTNIEKMIIGMLLFIVGGVLTLGYTEQKENQRLMAQCLLVKPEFECYSLLKTYRK